MMMIVTTKVKLIHVANEGNRSTNYHHYGKNNKNEKVTKRDLDALFRARLNDRN